MTDAEAQHEAWIRSGIDVGHGMFVHWCSDSHGPHRLLVEYHPNQTPGHEGEWCSGSIGFVNVNPPTGLHTLVAEDPLHVEASVLCTSCTWHGWLRDGRWHPV